MEGFDEKPVVVPNRKSRVARRTASGRLIDPPPIDALKAKLQASVRRCGQRRRRRSRPVLLGFSCLVLLLDT